MKNIVSRLTACAIGAILLAGAGSAAAAVSEIRSHGDAGLPVVPTTYFGSRTLTLQTWDVHTTDGSVFLALCIEPSTKLIKENGPSYAASKFDGFATDKQVQRLYSGYYAAAQASVADSWSFQLALWELYNDTGDVLVNGTTANRGALSFTLTDRTSADIKKTVGKANEMLQYALGDAAIVNEYTFTQYTLTGSQTIVAAAPLAAVPEPATYAMLGLGLGLVGFAARRRNKR